MGKKIARIIGRVLLVVLVTIVMLVGTLFIMIKRICSDSAPAARNLFISTVLESGQMKFLASWFCTDALINEILIHLSLIYQQTQIHRRLTIKER